MKDSAGNGTKAGLGFSSLMEPASEMETNRNHAFNNAPIESKFPAYVLVIEKRRADDALII